MNKISENRQTFDAQIRVAACNEWASDSKDFRRSQSNVECSGDGRARARSDVQDGLMAGFDGENSRCSVQKNGVRHKGESTEVSADTGIFNNTRHCGHGGNIS